MDAESCANTLGGAAKASELQGVLRILCMSAKDIEEMLGVPEGDLKDSEGFLCKFVFDVWWTTYRRWTPRNAPLRDIEATWQLLVALNDLLPYSMSIVTEHEATACGHVTTRIDYNVLKAEPRGNYQLMLPHSTTGRFRALIWAEKHPGACEGKTLKTSSDYACITPESFLEFHVFDCRRPMYFRAFGPGGLLPRCPADRTVTRHWTFSSVHAEYSRRKAKEAKAGLKTKATNPPKANRNRSENRPRPAISPAIPMDTNGSDAAIPLKLMPQNKPDLEQSAPSADRGK